MERPEATEEMPSTVESLDAGVRSAGDPVGSNVTDWQEFRRAAAALADENRLRIVRVLLAGPATVTDLTVSLSLRQPLVSHHLAVLSEAGLVSCGKDGRRRIYATTGGRPGGAPGALLAMLARLVAPSPPAQVCGDPTSAEEAGVDLVHQAGPAPDAAADPAESVDPDRSGWNGDPSPELEDYLL